MGKSLLATFICLLIIDALLPNVSIANPVVLIIVGVTLTVVQVIIRPVLGILLLPLTVITLGLFNSLLQVFLLWAVTAVVPGFHIDPMIVLEYRVGYVVTLVIVGCLLSWGQRFILTLLQRL